MASRLLPIALVLAVGCEGWLLDPASPRGGPPAARPGDGAVPGPDGHVEVDACRRPSQVIYEGLAPICSGCHASGSFPAFATLESFERLIAYEPRLVQPGDPASSRLVALLDGVAAPPLDRMPPGDRTYAEIAEDPAAGATISMSAIREWITALTPCAGIGDDPDHPIVTRVRAEQIRNALEQQLGITQGDVPGEHRLWSSVDIPAPETPLYGYGLSMHYAPYPTYAFRGLGGPDYFTQAARSSSIDASFFRAFYPVAQAWCAASVARADALFSCEGCAGRDATSATDEAAIRTTIAYQFDRLLAEVATEGDVDAMYREVFLPYEASSGSRAAWTAVCATFLRDPLWLTY